MNNGSPPIQKQPALRDILRQDDGARFVLDYKIR